MPWKVIVPEKLDKTALDLIKKDNQFNLVELENPSREALKEAISDCDALIVRSTTQVDKELIDAGIKLEIIGRAGVGTDNIDLNYAEKKGILVVNAPEESLDSVADLTMGLIISLCRKLHIAFERTRKGDFGRKDLLGCELRGLTIGLIGCGRIGRKVAQRAKAFGLNIIATDPYINPKILESEGIHLVSLNNLLKTADIISLHLPLTEDTHHLLSQAEFQLMKKGVYFINTSRAGLVDSDALIAALDNGHLAGAGLDVIKEKDPNNPLLRHPNVIVSPHLGASTFDAQRNVGLKIVQEVMDILKGLPPRYPVNFPKLPSEAKELYPPFRDLLSRMASILQSLTSTSFSKITLFYPKNLPQALLSILTHTFLAVFLRKIVTSTEINIINSQKIAEERDIHIVESIRSAEKYRNTVEIQIEIDGRILNAISGHVSNDNRLIISKINKYNIKFELAGHLFLIEFLDQPGMIGAICSFLGQNKINIAELQVARILHLGNQLMAIKVDNMVAPDIIKELRSLNDIKWVHYYSL
ncbi:MAG: phosphoglycerate dehydrogenase [Candidatus Helarchaeota archaeon]